MPQKKTVRRVKVKKPTAKRPVQKGILALAEKVEKEFRQLPAKLAKLYRQEFMIQKQQESRLKTEIKNAEAQQKEAQKTQTVLLKAKTTQTNKKSLKKQLATAKKSHANAGKTIKTLAVKLNQVTKSCAMLLERQNKFGSLSKELVKLEKQLTAQVKPPVKIKKVAAKSISSVKTGSVKKPRKQKAVIENTMTEELPFMISPTTETVEE